MKMACYYLRFMQKTSRTVTTSDITLANVRELCNHREWAKNYEEPDPPEINPKN